MSIKVRTGIFCLNTDSFDLSKKNYNICLFHIYDGLTFFIGVLEPLNKPQDSAENNNAKILDDLDEYANRKSIIVDNARVPLKEINHDVID